MTCTWLMPDAPDKHGRAFRSGALLITHAPKIEQKQNKEELLLVPGWGVGFLPFESEKNHPYATREWQKAASRFDGKK